jgi:hypothetical protein
VIAAFACGMAASTVLLAVAWYFLRSQIAVVESRTRTRVIVTLKSTESFSGVLFEHDRKALVLREAEALGIGERRENLTLDGELIILMPDVAYIQRP